MIRKSVGLRKKYKDNTSQIGVKKKVNNMQFNSPNLSLQENNYFYNTKINRLILQEAPNNNVQNIYQQPSHNNNDFSVGNGILQGKVNNFIEQKNNNENFYHRNSSFQKLPVDMMNIKLDDNYDKDINEFTYINFNNNSKNNNYNNIPCNNKTEKAIISKSLRITFNKTNQQDTKKIYINNYQMKNNNTLDYSPENNNHKIGKNSIKKKI